MCFPPSHTPHRDNKPNERFRHTQWDPILWTMIRIQQCSLQQGEEVSNVSQFRSRILMGQISIMPNIRENTNGGLHLSEGMEPYRIWQLEEIRELDPCRETHPC